MLEDQPRLGPPNRRRTRRRAAARAPNPAPASRSAPLAPGEAGLTAGEAAFVNAMLAWYERDGRPRDPAAEERVRIAVEVRAATAAIKATTEP
jgi:hypothetical protein